MGEQAHAAARGHAWNHNVEWQLGTACTALLTKCPLCPRVNTLCCLDIALLNTVFIGEGWQDWVITHSVPCIALHP